MNTLEKLENTLKNIDGIELALENNSQLCVSTFWREQTQRWEVYKQEGGAGFALVTNPPDFETALSAMLFCAEKS